MQDEQRARLIAELLPPIPRADLRVEFVRELTSGDLQTASLHEKPKSLKSLRQAHHQLARLLARGTSPAEANLITGFDLEYIYGLQLNETFKELLEHYRTVESIAEADIRGQMTSTGQMALQELGRRLEDSPEEFSVGQLHGTIDILLVQPNKGQGGGPMSPSSPPAFTLNFVNSSTPALRDVIDVTPQKGEN